MNEQQKQALEKLESALKEWREWWASKDGLGSIQELTLIVEFDEYRKECL